MSSNKSDNIIQAYIRLNIGLVRSLCIKSSFAEQAINKKIKRDYGESAVNRFDPTSWKYYMNLAGEYHPLDKPMYVASLDVRETILFSKENLVRHTATAEAYQLGSRYYLSLVREFPDQVALIKGILYPADKYKAIEAKDGSILSYRPSLVEENETTLIIELEDYIKRMMARWFVSAYSVTDPYYPAVFFSGLSGLILLQLLQLRQDRCKTGEVHTFHLNSYLGSHNNLDQYLKYLTREQMLYLYRNIKYIQRNVGNSFMYEELIREILEKRRIPLTDYTMRQLQAQTSEGYPVVQARRVSLTKHQTTGLDPYVSLDTFFNKELKTAPGNERYFQVSQESMVHQLATSNSSVIRTKDLESAMVDMTDAVPDTMEEVFMREWLHMTHIGLYNVVVNFQDPITTEERSLLSKDAIIYMVYLQFKSQGMKFDTLPIVSNMKYRRHPRPFATDLKAVIPSDLRYDWLRDLADDLVAAQPILVDCTSVTAFYAQTYKIYEECLKHFYLQAECGHPHMRGVIESMTDMLFGVAYWDFGGGENIEEWRVRNNLPPYTYTKAQAELIIKELFERSTGYRIDETKRLRNVQRALVNLFQDLSSYSIQVMREINDNKVLLAGMPELRVGYEGSVSATTIEIPNGTYVTDIKAKSADKLEVNNDSFPDFINVKHGSDTHFPDIIEVRLEVTLNDSVDHLAVVEPGTYAFIRTGSPDPLTGEVIWDDPEAPLNYTYEQAVKLAQFLGETKA